MQVKSLAQFIQASLDATTALERALQKRDLETARKSKALILDLQKKISDEIKKLKK